MRSLKKKIKEHFHEVLRTKKSPHSIALGFAIGSFIALLPIPAIDFFIGFALIAFFTKLNKYTLILGIAIWNPLTKIPLVPLSYKIGDMFFGTAPPTEIKLMLFDRIVQFSKRFLIGNIIISILISLLSYILVFALFWAIYTIRHRRPSE